MRTAQLIVTFRRRMKEQAQLQALLQQRLAEIRTRNPSFSNRAYAKRLNLSSGALSEILSGHRKVSPKLAERLCTQLAIDPQERAELLSQFPKKRAYGVKAQLTSTYLQLSSDQFQSIADGLHFSLMSLMNTADFKSSTAWMSQRLNVSEKQIKQALARLERMELIELSPEGEWSRTSVRYRTSDDIANASVKQSHAQSLEKAQLALQHVPVTERDFTSITMAIDTKQLARAKEIIRRCQDELSDLLESGQRDAVYQLCVQLFPLTSTEKT